jgi:uncharacterized protein (TIGR00255 family)
MILSMTGYGSGSAQKEALAVTVEIRTVNHRFLDLHIRLSREYLFLEGEIQQLIRGALDRGRVEVSTTIQNANSGAVQINSSLVKGYLEAAAKLKQEFNLQDSLDMKSILSLPGILQNRDTVTDNAGTISELVHKSVKEAVDGVLQMRRKEGEALRADMMRNLAGVEESARQIRELSVNSAPEYLQKLQDRLKQLLPQGSGMDPQRLAQEAALLADKCDISEEVARLKSHIQQYYALIDGKEKAGKKLDFLLQELQREANTILSKSGDLEISRNAIAIKADIEKLREQVQNVE